MSNIKIKNQQFTETIFDILRDMRLGQRYTDGNWSYQKFKINNGNKFGEFGKGAETVRNQKKIEAVLELLGVGEAEIFKEHSNYIELSFRPYTNDKFKDSVFRKDNRDKKRIISLLKFLSAKTGVEFEEITREQADKHIKKRNKNFKIRGANVAGKAYVVTSGGDNATSEVAAEEMLHPLVEFYIEKIMICLTISYWKQEKVFLLYLQKLQQIEESQVDFMKIKMDKLD